MITYETLRKIVNDERNSTKLAAIPESFFAEIREYIEKKSQITNSKEDAWELESAKRLLQDLLELREKKILTLALFNVRSGVIAEGMTVEERNFFDDTIAAIKKFQKERKKAIEGEQEKRDMVAILASVPEFLGVNMKTYGPFNEGDVATLPEANANVLVEKKAARRIKVE